jgi:hypothetical protein
MPGDGVHARQASCGLRPHSGNLLLRWVEDEGDALGLANGLACDCLSRYEKGHRDAANG